MKGAEIKQEFTIALAMIQDTNDKFFSGLSEVMKTPVNIEGILELFLTHSSKFNM